MNPRSPGLLEILPASIEDYPAIQNMARFYLYDMSKFCHQGSKDWAIPEDGLYVCNDFKSYFEAADRKAYLVKIKQELAGFVLLNKKGTCKNTDWNMGEFFILGRFQKQGFATQTAYQIWRSHPGHWEIAVIPENMPALSFWRKSINEFTQGNYQEVIKKIDYDKHQPKRCIFTFQSADVAP